MEERGRTCVTWRPVARLLCGAAIAFWDRWLLGMLAWSSLVVGRFQEIFRSKGTPGFESGTC